MSILHIIRGLIENQTEFKTIAEFSKLPGIYAFFYTGNNFPILGDTVQKGELIYIGKTESSQEKRDAKTHFKSGKTGSSTVRKSIGSLLFEKENLKPIPRNDVDYKKGRFSHFKFEENSEEKITDWMKENIAISFYEYPKSKSEIDELETQIINEITPVLNISKNSKNHFARELKKLRKKCALEASTSYKQKEPVSRRDVNSMIPKSKLAFPNSNSGRILIDNITDSDVKTRKIRIKSDNKFIFPKEKLGHSATYDLSFKINNQIVTAKYTIGSKDGKSRSGILKLGNEVYENKLKITQGTNLEILKSDNFYSIRKL